MVIAIYHEEHSAKNIQKDGNLTQKTGQVVTQIIRGILTASIRVIVIIELSLEKSQSYHI
jgi:hypothetical protein